VHRKRQICRRLLVSLLEAPRQARLSSTRTAWQHELVIDSALPPTTPRGFPLAQTS